MKPSEYIIGELEKLKTNPVVTTDGKDLADLIYTLLLSKKFRKYSVNPEYLEHISSAIKTSLSNNGPIKLTLVFGGYKLWRLEESPEVDWAELFSLIYYTKWLKPIAAVYKPGVWFDFYSDDVILEIMDNVPKKDTEKYIESFKQLLEFIKPYIPANLKFTLNRVGEQYGSYDEFERDLEQSITKVKEALGNKLPTLTPEQSATVELNVKLSPHQEDDQKWKEKVFLTHEGYASISKRRPYYRTPDKIMIITRPIKDSIAVGTTKKSVVKFWIGAGLLEKINDSYIENIFSPNQLASNKTSIEEISIKGLESKNFKKIRILG